MIKPIRTYNIEIGAGAGKTTSLPVQVFDQTGHTDVNDALFRASNIQQGNPGVLKGSPNQTSSGDQTFSPKDVPTATLPKGQSPV
jgi:hypothetical protein